MLLGSELLALQGTSLQDLAAPNRLVNENRLRQAAGECLNQYSVMVYLLALLSSVQLRR